MSSNAFAGVGTVFKRASSDSSGALFATLAEVVSISGPNMSRSTIDVTSLDSTGGYKEFIASFRDAGEVSLELNFTRDTYLTLKTDFESSTRKAYQIVLSDTGATTFEFSGLVTALGMAVPMDDKVQATATVKISGQITVSS